MGDVYHRIYIINYEGDRQVLPTEINCRNTTVNTSSTYLPDLFIRVWMSCQPPASTICTVRAIVTMPQTYKGHKVRFLGWYWGPLSKQSWRYES